jgi:ssDNA-binding Zn-finger/Zn-ribbon topoisomerase 1
VRAKLSHKEYDDRVRLKHGDKIKVLSEYTGMKNKIRVRHNVETCGFEWEAIAEDIQNGKGCPKCGGTMKLTHDEYVRRINEKHNGEIEVLGRYIRGSDKLRFKHSVPECQFEWEAIATKLLHETGCPKCAGNLKLTQDEFEEKVRLKHNGEIEVLGQYTGVHNKVLFRHVICGHEFESKANNVANAGQGCPICNNKKRIINQRLTHDEYIKRVNDRHHGEIEVLDIYTKANEKIRFRHSTCGFEWKAIAYSVSHLGRGCPRCASSKGESLIRWILIERNIEFKEQFIFNDCRYKRPLPFDFAVFVDSDLAFLIEYDGIQHFKPTKYSNWEDGFEAIQLRDRIKDEYCDINDIPLLRIPYWKTEEDVSDMIDDMLAKYMLRRIAS